MASAHRSRTWGGRARSATPRPAAQGRLLVAVGALLIASAGTLLVRGVHATSARVSIGAIPASDVGHSVTAHGGAQPTRIDIADIGVHAAVVPVGLTPARHVEVPRDYAAAGWWSRGTGVGVVGSTVLVGHVDDTNGPAVFYRLKDLRPGARVTLTALTGPPGRYVVDAVRQYPDRGFPSEIVYGATTRPTLRLITCGGYNYRSGHYEDNVVVFAHQTGQS